MATVLLCRHGETVCNASGILQGQMDSDLNAAGREQAVMLGTAVADRRIGNLARIMYSSDLSRARDTAAAVMSALQASGQCADPISLTTDPRLRERALGPFQGLTARQCDQQHREAWRAFNCGSSRAMLDQAGAAGVEDNEQLGARASAALQEIAARHCGETVILVSHGGFIHTAVTSCTDEGDVPHIGNGSITTLELARDGRGWLVAGPADAHIRVGVAGANADVVPLNLVDLRSKA